MTSAAGAPAVSVVMPVYRVERYVARAVASVLAQDFTDFELILVDDASPDASMQAVASFVDPRIRRLAHASNRGLAGARNTGIAAARGRYIALLDSDDMALPDRLGRQVQLLDAHPQLVGCGGHMRFIDTDDRVHGTRHAVPSDPDRIAATLLFHNCFFVSTLMVRAPTLQALGYRTDFPMAEDYELMVRAARCGPLTNLAEDLLRYRVHGTSLTATRPQQMRECVQRVAALQLAELGLDAGPQELALHHHVGHLSLAPERGLVERAEAWLLGLLQANERRPAGPLYDRAALRAVVADRWFEVCSHASTLGPWVLQRHRRSLIGAPASPGTLRRWKMLAKALLGGPARTVP